MEARTLLGMVATAGVDADDNPAVIFATIWRRIYHHPRDDRHLARFRNQIDESPLRGRGRMNLFPETIR